MATTIHEPPTPEIIRLPELGRSGGGAGWPSSGGTLRSVGDHSPAPSSSAIWVGVAAICMSFAAFTSALIVRQGGSTDWRHITLPSMLYLDTLVLLASSFTLEIGRRRVAAFMSGTGTHARNPASWLYVTLFLGLVFVAGQYVSWMQLKAQGLYLATNPSSSFFYVLTAIHALHVLGGLGGLGRVIVRLNRSVLRRSTLNATVTYWHFMDVLWLYLLWLLWAKV